MYYSFEEKRGELLEEAGIQQKDVSVRTVSRFLNSQITTICRLAERGSWQRKTTSKGF